MSAPSPILQDLAVVLGVAAVTTVVFQRLRQPVVLGYLLAGMIVGPHIRVPLIADMGRVHTLSELGVILLMFSLGLEFTLARLAALGPRAGLTALFEVSVVAWLGYLAGQMLGWSVRESIFTGAMVAISSTMIIAKAFAEQPVDRRLKELVYGILVFEDLIAIVMLAALTALASGAGLSGAALATVGVRLGGFLVAVVVLGLVVVPRSIRLVARLRRSETLVVASIGLCFTLALLAEKAGYSVALGAFIAGSLVAESGEGARIEHLIKPVRDMFAAVFFVSVGMSIDPSAALRHSATLAVLAAVVTFGKIAGVGLGAFLTGHGVRTSVQAGMSLAQIGELSFIIAGVASTSSTGETASLYPLAVGVSAVTTFATPWLIRISGRAASWTDRKLPRPLQTFVTLYGSWVERVGAPRPRTQWSSVRRLAFLTAADAACLAGIVVGFSLNRDRVVALLRAGEATPAAAVLTAIAASVFAAPFLIGMVRCARSLGQQLAVFALPSSEDGRLDLAAAPRRALVVSLQLGTLLAAGVPLVAVTQPFVPALPSAILLAAAMLLLGVAFWRNAANLQGHVQAGSEVVIETLKKQAAAGADDSIGLHDVEQLLPGLGTMESIRIPHGAAVVGRSLSDLDVRGVTGATVLAIRREDRTFLVPTARERLQDGDVLAMTGSREAIENARALLLAGPTRTESVTGQTNPDAP
ncbi:MAG: cation:proton antiporter [Acidobacteriota bacterium]